VTGLLQRAVTVLDVLRTASDPIPIREIAKSAGLSKSAAQRLLAELVTTELASQDPVTKRYHLGPRTLALGIAYQRRIDIRRIALPHMRGLRDQTGETIGLSVGLGDQLLHIDQVESESRLRALFDIGRPLPLWSGAPSRLLLAERTDDEIRRIVSERSVSELAPSNPPTEETLIADVSSARGAGYAVAHEETLPGVSTISAPVHGSAGNLVATLSLTAPSSRLTTTAVEDLLPHVIACADGVSSELGWMRPVSSRPRSE